ncbi:MAG: PssD/Cps14F family polysaccharide biosynthesis glycosyltransferase [Planctomycetota bacterium]|jgi:UDP-N-acetylglucosamine:LPS N-acetylglucosamine transferase
MGELLVDKESSVKIAVACSPGGHLVQARQIAPVYEQYEHFYVTFSGGIAEEMKKYAKLHSIPDLHRYNPLTWISNIAAAFNVARREKPDIVISTGAGAVVFFCLFAKLFGAKLLFIESMAKVVRPTWTSRVIYPVADLFLVQWPGLVKFFPKAKFLGRFF